MVSNYIRKLKIGAAAAILIILLFLIAYIRLIQPPGNFPDTKVFRIERGQTLSEVANALQDSKLIKSAQTFSNLVIFFESEEGVIAGDYLFTEPESVLNVSKRLTEGQFGFQPIKITIPEGLQTQEVAVLLEESLPNFNKSRFLALADVKEGYLFPDTYFFLPTTDESEVVLRMEEHFEDRIETVSSEIREFGRPLDEVVIMASILEEEAVTTEDRRIVSGILWKRIQVGMPLQVDAAFLAINGKKTDELTREDLMIDSPYNTYRYRGLTPGPISSPGLDSILAAVNPIETEYFYYLSEDDGTMHYAETLEEHNENKAEFLN